MWFGVIPLNGASDLLHQTEPRKHYFGQQGYESPGKFYLLAADRQVNLNSLAPPVCVDV